jgi:hypothetical protein
MRIHEDGYRSLQIKRSVKHEQSEVMFCVVLDDNYCKDAYSVLIHGVSGISLKVFGQGDGAG